MDGTLFELYEKSWIARHPKPLGIVAGLFHSPKTPFGHVNKLDLLNKQ
jgi:hypothetical protein